MHFKYAMKTNNFWSFGPFPLSLQFSVLECHLTRQEIYAGIQLSAKFLGHFQAYK